MKTKRVNQEAAKIVPMDKESAVLAWLAGKGNELNWKAINEAAGRTETARLNVGKDYSTEEVKLRDYASKERNKGLTLRDAAHKIWEDVSKRNPNITSDEVEEALLTAIRENPTRTDAARSLISISGAETAPMSIEEGELAYYQRKGEEAPQEEPFYLESGFVPFQEEEGLEEAPFAVQEKALDEVNDMKDIVKDLVEEGVLNLNTIKNRVAKELGYDSKRLRQTVDKAYQEYTKESTPKEVTSGVIGKVGTFLSDLFGGKAKDRVFVAKYGKSLMAKANEIGINKVEFMANKMASLINNVKLANEDISELLDYLPDAQMFLFDPIQSAMNLNEKLKGNEFNIPINNLRKNILNSINNAIEFNENDLPRLKSKILNKEGDIQQTYADRVSKVETRIDKLKYYKNLIESNLIKTDDLEINGKSLPKFMFESGILGFTYNNKIYLNGEALNPNTPIHEAGHIWTEWVKQNDPKVYERGIELVKNSDYLKEVKSSKFYQDQAKKLGSKSEAELYFQHEALAMAIGDKGAQFVTESKRASFKDWLNELWGKIKSIVGFKDITPEELQNLTFDEFTKMAVKDILGEQFEGRSLQEAYDMLPNGKKLRQNKENTLIKNNFENIVNELIKKKKIQKIC